MTIFFELLQIALGNRQSLSRIPSDKEWAEIYHTARQHTIAGIMYEAVARLDAAYRPPKEILLRWFATTEQIRQLNRGINREVRQLSQQLTADGWRNVLLKGQGIALLYPDPLLRTPGDIDIYLDGERKTIVTYLRQKARSAPSIFFKEAIFPYFEETTVEIHFTPAVMRFPLSNLRLQRFICQQKNGLFDNKAELPEAIGTINVPTKFFNAVFLLTHIYRHLFGEGIGLRQVIDYYYFLLQGLTAEERFACLQQLKRLRMLKFTRGLMFVLHAYLGLETRHLLIEPDPLEGKFLLEEIMRGGNFNRYEHNIIPPNETKIHRFRRVFKANAHLLTHYPTEVVFNPIYSIWQNLWLWKKGYAKP